MFRCPRGSRRTQQSDVFKPFKALASVAAANEERCLRRRVSTTMGWLGLGKRLWFWQRQCEK